ncbi:hypothetical protein [Chitinimonas sp. BJYL2]|uniref:hypothetical protein n=1 Tax=Chitinimonas sp. BJYL2 TaxID=2976696 RepID=UPI0022B2F2C8|nr:hypothetical protein [Chitinimonas sp. BJYL2]
MTGTDSQIASDTAQQDRRDANTIPQFFISLVNQCPFALTLNALDASAGCGWVQEPLMGEQIDAHAEKVWCGMPWDEGTRIDVAITLHCAKGTVWLRLERDVRQAALGTVSVDGEPELCARAELQRADSVSPFLMVVVHTT